VAGIIVGVAIAFLGIALATSGIALGSIDVGRSVVFGVAVILAGALYALAHVVALLRLRGRGASPSS
jgi:hypothetical protein